MPYRSVGHDLSLKMGFFAASRCSDAAKSMSCGQGPTGRQSFASRAPNDTSLMQAGFPALIAQDLQSHQPFARLYPESRMRVRGSRDCACNGRNIAVIATKNNVLPACLQRFATQRWGAREVLRDLPRGLFVPILWKILKMFAGLNSGKF